MPFSVLFQLNVTRDVAVLRQSERFHAEIRNAHYVLLYSSETVTVGFKKKSNGCGMTQNALTFSFGDLLSAEKPALVVANCPSASSFCVSSLILGITYRFKMEWINASPIFTHRMIYR